MDPQQQAMAAALAGVHAYPQDDPISGVQQPNAIAWNRLFGAGAVPKAGQTLPPQSMPHKPTADELISAAGPLGDAGMQLGDMLRTGNYDTRDVAPILGGAMMGVAGPKGEGAAAAAVEDAAPAIAKSIRAYHGSPYDFNQFDLSKIGTGEGAQSLRPWTVFCGEPSHRRGLSRTH